MTVWSRPRHTFTDLLFNQIMSAKQIGIRSSLSDRLISAVEEGCRG
jgi:hypothetical protein